MDRDSSFLNNKFPETFLWGAATSSHQVEGANTNNDWWFWEKEGKTKDPSGQATRHYELFDQDFQLARDLNHNAHRFSIEWSRVEPEEDIFDEAAIKHYCEVIQSLRQKSIEPIVTLHHFTNPKWFFDQGGWLNTRAPFWFTRYTEKIVSSLGRDIRYWTTINEPMVFAYQSYLHGIWPPGQRSVKHTWQVIQNLIKAHKSASLKIHDIYQKNDWTPAMVSIAKNLLLFKVCPNSNNFFCRFNVFLRHRFFNLYFLEKIKSFMDFIGVNYYMREYISLDPAVSLDFLGGKCNIVHGHVGHVNTLSWDSCPEGLFEVLCWLKKFKKPILITENGTCEEDDELRWQFIDGHLKALKKAIDTGIPVIGYLYWSLLDNFEWHHGYGPRFGIIEVDYKTFKRTPRPSALHLSKIFSTNRI